MEDTILENVLALYHTLIHQISVLEKKINEQQDLISKLVNDLNHLNREMENIVVSAFVNRDLQGHRLSHEKRDKKWKIW